MRWNPYPAADHRGGFSASANLAHLPHHGPWVACTRGQRSWPGEGRSPLRRGLKEIVAASPSQTRPVPLPGSLLVSCCDGCSSRLWRFVRPGSSFKLRQCTSVWSRCVERYLSRAVRLRCQPRPVCSATSSKSSRSSIFPERAELLAVGSHRPARSVARSLL